MPITTQMPLSVVPISTLPPNVIRMIREITPAVTSFHLACLFSGRGPKRVGRRLLVVLIVLNEAGYSSIMRGNRGCIGSQKCKQGHPCCPFEHLCGCYCQVAVNHDVVPILDDVVTLASRQCHQRRNPEKLKRKQCQW